MKTLNQNEIGFALLLISALLAFIGIFFMASFANKEEYKRNKKLEETFRETDRILKRIDDDNRKTDEILKRL